MMDWNVFYRAIGIAENIIDPSYYHILGLTARDCDAEKVQKALAEKKRDLRQAIPSPEFIAPVLLFEKEVLEKAASVLGDDQQRAAYNKGLLTRQREIETKNRKKQKLIDDVRAAIAEAVDEKGCLGGPARGLLEEKLRLIEVQEHNIRQILARIPEPAEAADLDRQRLLTFFAEAVQLGVRDHVLGAAEERHLMQLAFRLGLDELQARLVIDQQLAQLSATRPAAQQAEIILEKPIRMEDKDVPVPPPEIKLKKKPAAKQKPETPQDIEEAVDEIHRLTADKVFRVVAPVLAIAVFIATVYFLNAMNRKRNAVPDMSDILPAKQPQVEKKAPKNNAAKPEVQQPKPSDQSPDVSQIPVEVPQITEFESDFKDVELSDAQTASVNKMLADIGMLTLAIQDRASHYSGNGSQSTRQLEKLKASGDRVKDILSHSKRMGMPKVKLDAVEEEIMHLRLKTLVDMLHSESQQERYYAIGRLGSIGQRAAYEILLEALEDRTIKDKSGSMIGQMLNVLAGSNSTTIAHKLAEIMERAGRQTAFQIETTLMGMTQITPSGAGVLPVKNNLQQRKAASAWWQNQLWSWQGEYFDPQTNRQPYAFETTLKLTATASELIRQATMRLSDAKGQDKEVADKRLQFEYGFEADLDMLKCSPSISCRYFADELERLVRRGDAAAAKADVVALNRRAHLLAADDDSQAAAVHIAAANDFFAILAEQADSKGQYRTLIREFRQRFQPPASGDGLVKLRHECYLNVLYWDLLLTIQKGGEQ